MPTCKAVLNELKWRKDRELGKAEIWYVHRGAPGDVKVVQGSEIKELLKSFMKTSEALIPYHRILKIVYGGKVIWERGSREPETNNTTKPISLR